MKTAQVVVFTERHNSWLIYSVGFGKTTHQQYTSIPSGCTMRNTCKLAASDPKDQRLLEQESYLRKRYYANLTQSESSNDNFGWGCNWVFNSKWILYFAYLPLQCIYIPPRSFFQNSLLLLRCCRNKGFVVPVISYCRDSVVKPKRSRFACFSCFPVAIMIHTLFLLQN